ncbi:hypothetical protein [Hydrogenophaga sp.]|uniref:hypothetical protein n=1 Tax=Hydrogenophaga sp. TaxID=1904254 RepID=UPI003F6CFD8F
MASHAPLQKPPEQAITPWLQHLSQLMPPTGVLLVGAGAGTGPWVQLLQTLAVPSATLVEADDTQFEHLQRSVPPRDGWRLRKQVVGPHTETVAYHQASNATESGLLEPESLRSLWPNLKTTHKQNRQAIALAELQQDTSPPANWLLVDCLPALPIIQGAAQQLAAFDVIALRVLLSNTQDTGRSNDGNNTHADTELTQTASANALHPALQALGFRCLAIETSRHPAIGHALFVRDTAALAQQLQQQLAHQAQTLAQTQAQAQATAQQLEAQHNKLSEQLQQAQAAAEKAKAAAAAAATATSAATAATAAAAKQAEERAAQVQQLTQAKAAADKMATERQQQLDQLQTQLKQATEQAQAATQDAENAKAAAAAAATATSAATAADKLATECQEQLNQLQFLLKQATEQAMLKLEAIEAANQRSPQQIQKIENVLEGQFEITRQKLQDNNQLITTFKQEITSNMKNQIEATINIRKDFEQKLKAELLNSSKQIEAFLRIQSYFGNRINVGEMHGFPISPDFGAYIIQLIESNDYDIVIEFGSGTSTSIIAMALEKVNCNRQKSKQRAIQFAFEHLEIYHSQTKRQLESAGLAGAVNLIYSPLLPYTGPNGKQYDYYSCQEHIEDLFHTNQKNSVNVLVVIDGPPGSTGKHARYPAVPVTFKYLEKGTVDFVLDDYDRSDEREITQAWLDYLSLLKLDFTFTEKAFEKGACLIRVRKMLNHQTS